MMPDLTKFVGQIVTEIKNVDNEHIIIKFLNNTFLVFSGIDSEGVILLTDEDYKTSPPIGVIGL